MKLNSSEKNALQAVEYMLWTSKVKVSSVGLKDNLVMHPDFPSLASVSDAFSEWQVSNLATRLSREQLGEIPLPALTYLNLRGGILAPVKSVKDGNVEWLDTQRGWQKDHIADFERKWNGVVLLLEPNPQSGEVDYAAKSRSQVFSNARVPFLNLGFLSCLLIILYLNWNAVQVTGLYFILLVVFKFIGTILGGLLLWQSLDTENPYLQNICHLSSQNNCHSILQSKASKIAPWLSWSEVGFVYFAGGLVCMIFALLIANFAVVSYLALLSLAALPYTVYSVWYQRFVVKEWCTLCLMVQILLWSESAIILKNISKYEPVWNVESLLLFALAFLIPTLIWILVKTPLTESSQLFEVQRELQKVKFNENYIQAVFSNQPKMPPIFENMQTAAIGDLDAPHVLTIVTNPLCGPCSRLHEEIKPLMENNTNIQCHFVFLGTQESLQIASTFLNSTLANRKLLMDSWYHNIQQNAEKWITAHKLGAKMSDQLSLHTRWCELAGIIGTPTVYINGIKIPTAFKIGDLKSILPLLKPGRSSVII